VADSFAFARPGPVLRDVVRRYCGYVERTPAPLRRSEPASATVTVILSFGPRIRVDGESHRSFVAGLSERPATTEHDGVQDGIQVDLVPLAARRLLGVPMHELAGRVEPLEAVLEPGTLLEELAEADGWEARFALLDAELARRLEDAPPVHPAVGAAYARLAATRGAVPVGVLATELGWSRRHLAARFRDEVGVPPKSLARLLRFRRALELLGRRDLAGVAYDCGYYDQSHFNRDFREFAGATPGELLARRLSSVQDAGAVAA
jgi:AraC-like DNA-binding protein